MDPPSLRFPPSAEDGLGHSNAAIGVSKQFWCLRCDTDPACRRVEPLGVRSGTYAKSPQPDPSCIVSNHHVEHTTVPLSPQGRCDGDQPYDARAVKQVVQPRCADPPLRPASKAARDGEQSAPAGEHHRSHEDLSPPKARNDGWHGRPCQSAASAMRMRTHVIGPLYLWAVWLPPISLKNSGPGRSSIADRVSYRKSCYRVVRSTSRQ